MSFDGEWSAARAGAHANVRMRLNQAAASGGGGGSGGGTDLTVDQDDLGAVGSEAYTLYNRLSGDGDHARQSTHDASIALINDNYALGTALLGVNDLWSRQLRTLADACANISNHLDHSAASHQKEEDDIVVSLRASQIDGYFT
ncbi:hypothetical protein [Streptomyces sp. NPDC058548]|uniref:hypothetical protein n=1 Tax=Streptomyces sp. NPDC058548 TaxID=3346545 RepID=UPI003660B953